MNTKQILFTAPYEARLVDTELAAPGEGEVLVRTEFTAISAGTERANLVGDKNISGVREQCTEVKFPRALGYSGAGVVEQIGSRVTNVKPGDRVVISFGLHRQYNLVGQSQVHKIVHESVTSLEAAFVVIAGFSIAGIRKTRLEIGESAMVMGLGILGILAVQLCRIAGGVPVIAVDPNEARRALALQNGADHALDPTGPDFIDNVKALTYGKGVNSIIEVSGVSVALSQALDCAAPFGRVALLGCSRTPGAPIDFYHQVHYPGVTIVGANNFARPIRESSPGNWTASDDYGAILGLIAGGRLNIRPLLSAPISPEDAPDIYRHLAADPAGFPIGVAFDWRKLN
ncbi:MAG TPA: zinc-binding alcohol dehydrogenase [Capsulimonadaceae bacterium]|jgi:2-desacetyl-2-hydroxyethyl bacteriochlorophyllide A dehydrogenase